MAYTKLHQSLITSTIWREPNHIRVAWITMLAMGDKNGEVLASVPGLADICRITIPQMEEALECFLAPDPYSRTKDHEGRRVVEIDGGWFLLNHPKYRKMASKEDETEKAAIRQANKRERDAALQSRSVTQGNEGVTPEMDIAEADTQAEAEADQKKKRKKIPPELPWVKEYASEIGLTDADAVAFVDHHQTRGWKLKGVLMVDWKAAVRTWKSNKEKFGSSWKTKSNATEYDGTF